MKIEKISSETTYYIETDDEEFCDFRRNGENKDAWEQRYYESWESLYDQEIIDFLNQELEKWKEGA